MSNTNIHQDKLSKLVFQLQPTLGTATGLTDANNDLNIVPAQDVSLARDRGTRLISRAALRDGFAGEVCGVFGSLGSTLTFTTELYDVGDDITLPYWGRLLLACGHEALVGEIGVDDFTIFTPSIRRHANFTAGSAPDDALLPPAVATFGWMTYVKGDATLPIYTQDVYDSTGSVEFSFTVGERATMTCTMVGRQSATLVTADTSSAWDDIGEFEGGNQCHPYVVKGIKAVLTDTDGTVDTSTLEEVTITSNAATPDNPQPTAEDGFGISPVLFDEAPGVTMTLGASAANIPRLWAAFRTGATMSLEVELASSVATSTRTVTFFVQALQYEDVVWGESNGYRTLQLTARAVRSPGGEESNTPPYSIRWRSTVSAP